MDEYIVAASGGFDPLHAGHVRYLQEAANLGSKLVVILNSDKFLMDKKGFIFMPFEERKEILEALSCVSEVIECIDEDSTVCATLRKLRPDVFAKGGDRTLENIPEKVVCEELNIKMIFDVGGGKIQSSSELARKRHV